MLVMDGFVINMMLMCLPGLNPNYQWDLQVTPGYGGMFGGKEVNVSAPCFINGDAIKCRFGEVITDGWIKENIMRATCHIPAQPVVGHIPLSLSIDGGVNFPFTTDYIIGKEIYITGRLD